VTLICFPDGGYWHSDGGEVIEAELQVVLGTLTEYHFQNAFK
jgi:hypothetical protein